MVECCNSLAKYLEDQGPNKAMDVDELLLRESMDVIGESQRDLATGCPPQLPGRSRLWSPQCGVAMLFLTPHLRHTAVRMVDLAAVNLVVLVCASVDVCSPCM